MAMTDHLRPTAADRAGRRAPGRPGPRAGARPGPARGAAHGQPRARALGLHGAYARGRRSSRSSRPGSAGPASRSCSTELALAGRAPGDPARHLHGARTRPVEAGDLVRRDGRRSRPGARDAPPLVPDPRAHRRRSGDGEPALRAVTVAGTDRYYDPRRTSAAGGVARRRGRASSISAPPRCSRPGLDSGSRSPASLVVARADEARRLSDEEVEAASLELGRLASAALLG